MCHASRREERRHKSYYSHHHSDRAEHHEQDERHAHHDRGERIRCFMSHHDHDHHDWDRSEGRSGFGVRRPLRFLAHKLDLDEKASTEALAAMTKAVAFRVNPGEKDRKSVV